MNQGFDWIQVQGESMRPMLRSGDWIGVSWCSRGEAGPFRPGDLLLGCHSDKTWLVHRLVDLKSEGRFLLKGDASTQTELLVAEEIWGKVVAVRASAEAGGKASLLRTSWLDQWIAGFSRFRLRRTVFVMAWIRKALLRRRAGSPLR